MKKGLLIVTGLLVGALSGPAQSDRTPKTLLEKASYGMGLEMGKSFVQQKIEIDWDLFAEGLKHGMKGGTTLIDEEAAAEASLAYRKQLKEEAEQRRKKEGLLNQAESVKFFAKNKSREGVVALPSGLQYQIIKPGNGAAPKSTDTVTLHYTGRLLNGEIFDTSRKYDKPVERPVIQMIKGWQEAVQMMRVGGSWRLFIPAELAYGQYGFPPAIGPNAAVVFDLDLLEVRSAGGPKVTLPRRSRVN
ncbi:MAG: FKBP-type peptidyl-prolyl cis-trans isomerase [Verrucomicrobiota bacterium]